MPNGELNKSDNVKNKESNDNIKEYTLKGENNIDNNKVNIIILKKTNKNYDALRMIYEQ